MLNARLRDVVAGSLLLVLCLLWLPSAQGQGLTRTVLSQNFDSVTPPDLPTGWDRINNPSGGTWTTAATSAYPAGVSPVNSPNMLCFNAHAALNNYSYVTLETPVDLTHYVNTRLAFWVYHDSGAASSTDFMRLLYSSNAWVDRGLGDAIYRYSATPGWQEQVFTFPAGAADGQSAFVVSFEGHGMAGNDIFIDDIRLLADFVPYCSPGQGSIGTRMTINGAGFGTKKGKVYLAGEKTPLKVVLWSDTSIVCDVAALYPVGGPFDVSVQPALPKGASRVTLPSSFSVMPPVIDDYETTGAPGAALDLVGHYLGPQKGKILLIGSGPKGAFAKSCKIASWTMNTTTGASAVEYIVPSIPSGTYGLVLQIKGMPDLIEPDAITVP